MDNAQDVRRSWVLEDELRSEIMAVDAASSDPMIPPHEIVQVVLAADYDTLLTKHRQLEADYAAWLKEAEHWLEYWNGHENETAMADALHHILDGIAAMTKQPHPGSALQPLLDAVRRLPKCEEGSLMDAQVRFALWNAGYGELADALAALLTLRKEL